jgi:hypothetical integral membrane protein (TIGR02206 family)
VEADLGELFAKDYTGGAFVTFGPAHLAFLAGVLVFNLVLIWLGRRQNAAERQRVRVFLAVWLVLNELAWHAWKLWIGQWTVQEMLPLHLCSVFVVVSAYMLVSRSRGAYEYAYFLGIAGALQALLTPDAGIYGLPHFRAFQTLTAHGLIITASVYMTLVEGYRPQFRSIGRVMLGANIYMAVIFFLNLWLGSNYLFIAHKPATASLLDLLPAWPWYIPFLELIGLAMCLLLYLPFAVRDWRARRRLQPAVS